MQRAVYLPVLFYYKKDWGPPGSYYLVEPENNAIKWQVKHFRRFWLDIKNKHSNTTYTKKVYRVRGKGSLVISGHYRKKFFASTIGPVYWEIFGEFRRLVWYLEVRSTFPPWFCSNNNNNNIFYFVPYFYNYL